MNQCKATAKGTGERCRRAPIAGGTVCRTHGGAAPQVKAKAARERVLQAVTADARATLALEGVEPIRDPFGALAGLASEVLGMKAALAARVNALDSITMMSPQGVETLRVEVSLYERALDRSARVLDVLTRAGFEERRAALNGRDARAVASMFANVMRGMELDGAGTQRFRELVKAEFKALGGAPSPAVVVAGEVTAQASDRR